MSRYETLQDFKEYELYPALWERIDEAFPEMDFKFVNGYWRSPKHLDGSEAHSKDQTFVHSKRKWLIKDNSDANAYSLIDFEMQRSHSDFLTAVKRLSDLCGLQLPNADKEEFSEYQKLQDDRETANRCFVRALWSGEGEADKVLSYLRDVRKWTDEEIRDAELGYVDEALLSTIPNNSDFSFKTQNGEAIGVTHRLSIPYRNGGKILGFKFRNIAASTGNKYLNSKGLSKGSGLFGIGIGVKDAVIVEGELDALHAKAKGAYNVVATTGNGIGEGQVRDAIRRGVKRFTLLFDNDAKGVEFTSKSIDTIQEQGGEVYVATLPQEIKDADEYLCSHTLEDFDKVVREAVIAPSWQYGKVVEKYSDLCEAQGGGITHKQREDFFDEVAEIVNSKHIKPHDREFVLKTLEAQSDVLHFDIDEERDWLNRRYEKAQAKRRAVEVGAALSEAMELHKGGKVDEALRLVSDTAQRQGMEERATSYAKAFSASTPQEYATFLSEIRDGVPTGFIFKQGNQSEPLTLNAGLTFICGYRGHGKTSFLNNIAINEAKRNVRLRNGKSVLYFSYEVDKRRLIIDLLNTFVNDADLSSRPTDTIRSYFKGMEGKYFKREGSIQGTSHFANFKLKKDIFIRNYLSTGALTVVEENYKVERLLEAIKYYISQRSVSIVCIDYAQLIYSEDYSRQRTEEIKKVVNDIKDFANKEGIPFVLAAQFNREVDSPVSVDTKNIGEGGDFERIADTCIGLYNLKELHPLPKNKDEEREAKRLLSSLLGESIDELKPIQDKIFARLMKRRYGYYPLDTILDWTGKTKYIKPNDEAALSAEGEQLSIRTDEDEFAPF